LTIYTLSTKAQFSYLKTMLKKIIKFLLRDL